MTTDQGKAAADMLATVWEGEFPATCAVIAAVKDDNRSYKPDPKSRTAWELATHLATADIWFIDSIAAGKFEWNPDAAKAAEARFTSVGAFRRPTRLNTPVESDRPSLNPRSGSWHDLQAIVPSRESRLSKNRARPRSICSLVRGLSSGTGM